MSETLYTCDCCVRNGNDEASCHRAKDLCVIGTDVVCEGCRWEEYPYDAFVMAFTPPHEKRISELESQLTELREACKEANVAFENWMYRDPEQPWEDEDIDRLWERVRTTLAALLESSDEFN